jgi:hypothetical protein
MLSPMRATHRSVGKGLAAVIACLVLGMPGLAYPKPLKPADVIGMWGGYDESTGQCSIDGVNVRLSASTLEAEIGRHGSVTKVAGRPKCTDHRCVVTTIEGYVKRRRTWTWTFNAPDIALITGQFSQQHNGKPVVMRFNYRLKRGLAC